MRGEIDEQYYCSAEMFIKGGMCVYYKPHKPCIKGDCGYCHCKYPTPEQFKKEYGKEYSYNGAIYYYIPVQNVWIADMYKYAKRAFMENAASIIICACTPWGCPPEDWVEVAND